MRIRIYFFFLSVFLSYIPVLAQVDTAWVRRYNGPGNGIDEAIAIAVDINRNVYVTGSSDGDSGLLQNLDYATIKYAPDGDVIWVRRYNGTGNGHDVPRALGIDKSGNLYVTGYSAGSGTYNDIVTIKYAPNGDSLWVNRYDGPVNLDDAPNALTLDDSGYVYVAGASHGSAYPNIDFITIKYTPNGDTVWSRRYQGSANSWDEAVALAVDDNGYVYVTGDVIDSMSFRDFATIKYTPDGDTVWVRQYSQTDSSVENPSALKVDAAGNVYVTGSSGYLGLYSYFEFVTIKYSPNGDIVWERFYSGPVGGTNSATALAVDDSGNVYVTGTSQGYVINLKSANGTGLDYATIKYAPNGDTLWVRRYTGPAYGIGPKVDRPNALAVDQTGNVYVTGYSASNPTYPPNNDYLTIKYALNGDTLWVRQYNGLLNDEDKANALAIEDSGYVYVTGISDRDYTTIKYAPCLIRPGDPNGDSKNNLADIIFLVNYVFKGGAAPEPLCKGDIKADGKINLIDVTYGVNYVFKGGPPPQKSALCCL